MLMSKLLTGITSFNWVLELSDEEAKAIIYLLKKGELVCSACGNGIAVDEEFTYEGEGDALRIFHKYLKECVGVVKVQVPIGLVDEVKQLFIGAGYSCSGGMNGRCEDDVPVEKFLWFVKKRGGYKG